MADGNELMTTQMLAQFISSSIGSSSNMAKMLTNLLKGQNNEVDKWFCDDDPSHEVHTIDVDNPAIDFMQRCMDQGIPLKIYQSDFGKKVGGLDHTVFAYRSCDQTLIEEIRNALITERANNEKNKLGPQTQGEFDGIRTNICDGLTKKDAIIIQNELSEHHVKSKLRYDKETKTYQIEIAYIDLSHEYITSNGVHKMNAVEVAFADAFIKISYPEYSDLLAKHLEKRESINKVLNAHSVDTYDANKNLIIGEGHVIYDSLMPDNYIEICGTNAVSYCRGKEEKTYDLKNLEERRELEGLIQKLNEPDAVTVSNYEDMMENPNGQFFTGCYEATRFRELNELLENNVCKQMREKGLIDINYIADVEEGDDPTQAKWKAKEIRIGNTAEVMEIMLKSNPELAKCLYGKDADKMDFGSEEDINKFRAKIEQKAKEIAFNHAEMHKTLSRVHDLDFNDPKTGEFFISDDEDLEALRGLSVQLVTDEGAVLLSEEDLNEIIEHMDLETDYADLENEYTRNANDVLTKDDELTQDDDVWDGSYEDFDLGDM